MFDEMNEGADSVAVIGLACRFPQAPDVETFWENLRRGVDSVTELSEEELAALPEGLLRDEKHVKASAAVDGIDLFDAAFFGLSPREAAAMDPQQRFFLEVGWEALERAGYPPAAATVGVYAAVSASRYLEHVVDDAVLRETMGMMQLALGNDKDHIATRLSYLLNLRGPSISVQTACSASLVAVHLACQSLLNHECDLALAGGCSIPYPNRAGYLYEEGGVLSPDGRCRAFDARARGTAQGSGVGLVVLKRLEEALADGDLLHAVIRGSAINNDGGAKVGYTAPSVEGQRRVIEEAIAVAGLEPNEISYVEAHGTGTTLGDPIEVEALRQAFGGGDRTAACALGSVKTNIGHLDTASGVAGLIKAILCLEHRTLVPSLHFETPNPRIDFAATPFFVNTELKPWERTPRYAGVSSFGIGGTNAHVVLAEAPPPAPSGPSREHQLVTLSARSPTALARLRDDLKRHLEAHPDIELADVAFTASAGRQAHACRDVLVCAGREELLAALDGEAGPSPPVPEGRRQVVFLFPGQGIEPEDLGQDLYHSEAAYRDAADRCFEILAGLGRGDLRQILLASDAAVRREVTRPSLWQPALFVTEYALAGLWTSWGLAPAAMIGHSLGEIVAATLAEVLTLEDALCLVTERGRLTEELPEGAMLAVPMSEEEIAPRLGGAVSLAAVNGPGLVVLSGPVAEIEALAEDLAAAAPIKLATRRAFHSAMVEPMVESIARLAASFELGPPKIPYLSNVTGTWMRDEDATDPGYWARHLRQPVRFHDGLAELAREPGRLLLEVGPGKVLTGLANRGVEPPPAVASLAADESAERALLTAAGELWRRGAAIDWRGFYAGETRRRVTLPTYPFERRSCWFEARAVAPPTEAAALTVKSAPQDWFYLPTWKQAPRLRPVDLERLEPGRGWLIFAESESGLGEALRQRLAEAGQRAVLADPRDGFDLGAEGADRVVFACRGPEAFDQLIRLAQAIGNLHGAPAVRLAVVTHAAERVVDEPASDPEQAALLGVTQVLPKELPHVTCQCLDVDLADGLDAVAGAVLAETAAEEAEDFVVFRRGRRWLPVVEPVPMNGVPPSPYRRGGVYLVTHGLQEIGLALAERLALREEATAVLVDRSFFPRPEEWDGWIGSEGEDDPLSRKIARLRRLGAGRVRVRTADPADRERLRDVLADVEREHGGVHGAFHLDPPAPETGLIAGKPADRPGAALAARIREAHNLEALLPADLDFLVVFSSNAAESGGLGQVDQAAACGFVERFAGELSAHGRRALAVAWGPRKWRDEGVGPTAVGSFIGEQLEAKREQFGMTAEECLDALERALGLAAPRLIVSTRDFEALMEQQSRFTADFFQQNLGAGAEKRASAAAAERPDLDTAYEAPRNEVERLLAEEWKLFFGLREVGVRDSFFELGGHSLLAVQVLKKVNETFSTRLGLQDFFDAPTIAGLAGLVSGAPATADETELAKLLSEIEGLSEEELESALGGGKP